MPEVSFEFQKFVHDNAHDQDILHCQAHEGASLEENNSSYFIMDFCLGCTVAHVLLTRITWTVACSFQEAVWGFDWTSYMS